MICLPRDRLAAGREVDAWIEGTVVLFDLKPESRNVLQSRTEASYQGMALLQCSTNQAMSCFSIAYKQALAL